MTLISGLLEKITGRDDLERIAASNDAALLDRYLEKRRLFFPKRPRQFLDPAVLTQDELMRLIQEEGEETAGDQIEFWILEIAGKRRLPAFSSLKRAKAFSVRMSLDLNKVFGLGCLEMLLPHALKYVDVDCVDLNPLSKQSWELAVGGRKPL